MDELEILQCPVCRERLAEGDEGLRCQCCDEVYPKSLKQVDLRPRTAFSRHVTFEFRPCEATAEEVFHGALPVVEDRREEWRRVAIPRHLSGSMIGHIPEPPSAVSRCLDLGCGNGEYKEVVEALGYRWIGCDYERRKAPILADAHALPFADGSFDFVISLAVLEHLKCPAVALREIRRTMRPHAVFLGSVTYLTPFHDSASYFNMTHEGVCEALRDAGFEVEIVAGEPLYSGLEAVLFNGLFLGMARRPAYALAKPLLAMGRAWWRRRRKKGEPRSDRLIEQLMNTGAFTFVARNPG